MLITITKFPINYLLLFIFHSRYPRFSYTLEAPSKQCKTIQYPYSHSWRTNNTNQYPQTHRSTPTQHTTAHICITSAQKQSTLPQAPPTTATKNTKKQSNKLSNHQWILKRSNIGHIYFFAKFMPIIYTYLGLFLQTCSQVYDRHQVRVTHRPSVPRDTDKTNNHFPLSHSNCDHPMGQLCPAPQHLKFPPILLNLYNTTHTSYVDGSKSRIERTSRSFYKSSPKIPKVFLLQTYTFDN